MIDASFPEFAGNLSAITHLSPSDITNIQAYLYALSATLCDDYLPAVAKLWGQLLLEYPTSVQFVTGPAACPTISM